MKKFHLIVLVIIFPFQIYSQKINNCGHIISKSNHDISFQVVENSNNLKVKVNNLLLDGNNLYETSNGYLTLTNLEENIPSIINIYDNNGKLLFLQKYNQVINLLISENKKYAVFYNCGNITTLHIQNFSETKYPSSLVFNIDNDGNPAYGDNSGKTLYYKNNKYSFENNLSKLVFFNKDLIVFTSDKMYCIHKGENKLVYSFNTKFFDASVINNKLYYVNRIENKDGFIFTLFETTDLKEFFEIQKEVYHFNSEMPFQNNDGQYSDSNNADGYLHEPIRGPINYFDNNVLYSIGNSYGEIQDFGNLPYYLHPGVDILGNPNQNVYAVMGGVVKTISTINGIHHWRIAISNTNTTNESVGYVYGHLNQASIPYLIGDIVSQGAIIGTLIEWPNYNFTHCHFARILDSGATWNGNWWTTSNPLVDFTNMLDSTPPVFLNVIDSNKFALRKKTNGTYIQPDSVYGNIEVISKIYDLANSNWKIDVYKIRYSMHPVNDYNNILFDSLAFIYDMPLDEYINNIYTTLCLNTIYSRDSTCFSDGDFETRDYYQIVTNSNGDDTITDGDSLCSFNTGLFPDGKYYFKITAWDASNNVKADSMLIHIKNYGNNIGEMVGINSSIKVYPNPNHGVFSIQLSNCPIENYDICITDALGNEIIEKKCSNGNSCMDFDLSDKPKGIYFALIKSNSLNNNLKIINE